MSLKLYKQVSKNIVFYIFLWGGGEEWGLHFYDFYETYTSFKKKLNCSFPDFVFNSPKQLFIEGSRNLHDDHVPLTAKIRNVLLKLLYRGSVPVHQLYSKYLLKSTLDKLIEEKDSLV